MQNNMNVSNFNTMNELESEGPITAEGFYNFDSDNTILFHAPNAVYNKNYELQKENKDSYDYPINNWYWFGSREEALNFYGITEEDLNSEINN